MTSKISVQIDPNIDPSVSKVLLIYDIDNEPNQVVIDFFSHLGYHVHSIKLNDDDFSSRTEMIREFDTFFRQAKKDKTYAFGLVHFCANEATEMCMSCNRMVQKNCFLLKQAFAAMYVSWGREICALINSYPCCSDSMYHNIMTQVEGMAYYYDHLRPYKMTGEQPKTKENVISLVVEGSINNNNNNAETQTNNAPVAENKNENSVPMKIWYPPEIWVDLDRRIDIRRRIEEHQESTRHVLTTQKEVVVEPEKPMNEFSLLQLVQKKLSSLPEPFDSKSKEDNFVRRVALKTGIPSILWEEHHRKTGDTSLLLVFKRIVLTSQNAYEKIASIIDSVFRRSENILSIEGDDSETFKSENIEDLIRICKDFQPYDNAMKAMQKLIDEKVDNVEQLAQAKDVITKTEVFLSKYPTLEKIIDHSGKNSRAGPWKEGVEKPVAEEGTHLDKVNEQFIPPYLRAMISQASGQTLNKEDTESIEREAQRVRELDQAYQKRVVQQEMSGQFVGAYSTMAQIPSRMAGGSRPI